MNGVRALAYLELRQLINRCRMVARRPARVLLYLFVLAYFVFVAVFRAGHRGTLGPAPAQEPYASAIFFAYIAFLGVVAYGAASGVVGAFSSTAEALFLTRSLIPERLVVAWLQLRRCASAMVRATFSLVIYTLMFAAGGIVYGLGLCVIAGSAIAAAQGVPMLKLRAVGGERTAQSVAGALAAIGLLPLSIVLSSLIDPAMHGAAQRVEQWGAGRAVNLLFAGDPARLAALFAAAALLVAISFALG